MQVLELLKPAPDIKATAVDDIGCRCGKTSSKFRKTVTTIIFGADFIPVMRKLCWRGLC
jgi:hypothetical protein